jgi:hypothetical protein
MDTGQWVVIILSVIIGGWYVGGYLSNRRLTKAVITWLHSGLEELGGIQEVEKLGTFAPGARLLVPKAVKPFKRLEAAFVLESRENLPFWIFNHLRGKRDELLLKGFLNRRAGFEVEVARAGNKAFEDWLSDPDNRHLTRMASPNGFVIYSRLSEREPIIHDLQSWLEKYGEGITRLSIRTKSPHLSMRGKLTPLLGFSSVDFFRALRGLFETD